MDLAAEFAAIIFLGLGLLGAARISRSRYVSKFGPPPPHAHLLTFGFFALCSLVYLLLGWFSPMVLAGVLAGAFALPQVIGFKTRPWSWLQQFRDGVVFASVFVAPFVLFVFWRA